MENEIERRHKGYLGKEKQNEDRKPIVIGRDGFHDAFSGRGV